jgi:hypothetical protein
VEAAGDTIVRLAQARLSLNYSLAMSSATSSRKSSRSPVPRATLLLMT